LADSLVSAVRDDIRVRYHYYNCETSGIKFGFAIAFIVILLLSATLVVGSISGIFWGNTLSHLMMICYLKHLLFQLFARILFQARLLFGLS